MENIFYDKKIEPNFYSREGIITEVNEEFTDFTGFRMDELLGKSLIEIGDMLKINSQMLLEDINSKCKYSGYIFTKFFEAKEVYISLLHNKITNENVYNFVEILNSKLDDKLIFVEQTFVENISGVAVYSVPDLILLKANQKYLDSMDSPFNKEKNSIGKNVREIVTRFAGRLDDVIGSEIIETQKAFYTKEFRVDDFEGGTTYWDSTQTPIIENGKTKYIFTTDIDVTERVLKNKNIEEQNKIIKQQKEQLAQQNTQLAQQNTQLIGIIENLSEGVTVTDNKGKFIMSNLEAKRLVYELDQAKFLGDAFKTTKYFNMKGTEIPFENLPEIRALRGERVKNAKIIVSNPSKKYIMEVSAAPIYNTSGDLTSVVSSFHDITETIEQSRKIEEQKSELEAIIENIDDGIATFDNKGKYISFNKSERELLFPYYEYTTETNDRYYVYIDKTSDSYNQAELYDIHGEEIDIENTPFCRVMRGEKFKNMRMAVKFPHKTLQIDVSGTPIYDSEGKFTLGILCSRDMTDYFKQEESIRKRYEFLNRMVDTFDLPVVRLSYPDLKIVDINKKAFSIVKLSTPNIKSFKQIIDYKFEYLFKILDTSEYFKYIDEVLKEKETRCWNKISHLINGKAIYWNIIFEPMLDVNGELQEILILIIDVTTEIKSNIVMEKALKSQGEFLVNISHELKTPLNVISSAAQLFDMYCKSGSLDNKKDSIIKNIDSIKKNSYRLSKIINNIVDLSKIETGFFKLNLSNNNIVQVVEEIVMSITTLTDSKSINIIFDTDIEDKIIACDPEKIERIVLNLISNAIKFSNAGDEIIVGVKDMNEFVQITVKDNGIGIEEEYFDMIFDRFKQIDKSLSRNAEGTGIGLSLVKSIVQLHGGSICVESEFGKGSKFTVMLPSRKVLHENMLYRSKVPSGNESIRVELSDVYSD